MEIINFDAEYKYVITDCIKGHTSDVRVVKGAQFPLGSFFTGSRDYLVKHWVPNLNGSYRESKTFIGAKNFIASLCALEPSDQYPEGLILAGSNDCSIYGFALNSKDPILKLLGHAGSVCSLSAGFGLFVSGSWDKTARIWSGQQCTAVLEGHSEAVWTTVVYPEQNIILTGSADHTIKVWRNGICENTFYGHEDCVRSLVVTREYSILSCSNDATVRRWTIQGHCLDVYRSHDNYIYDITLLDNGIDFATCGEDEKVKIWKKGRCAQTLTISSKTLWSLCYLPTGDLIVGSSDGAFHVLKKVEVDVLSDNGAEESVKEKPSFYGYEWNSLKNKWVKKHEATESNEADSYKMELDIDERPEKNKDFEFYVDIEGRLCKLELNRTEDPYDVALKFIAQYTLDPIHVKEITDFIVKHCTSKLQPTTNEFFPLETYYTYVNANVDGLRKKLLEFTDCVQRVQHIPAAKIEKLVLVANFPEDVSEEQMQFLDIVITWSDEYLYPALDLLRLAVRCKGVAARIGNQSFIYHLLQILKTTKRSINRVLVIKIFCNLFGFKEGEELMTRYQFKVCEAVKDALFSSDDKTHKSTSSLFLNYAIASFKGLSIDIDSYCIHLIEMLKVVVDPDSLYKGFISIGTVCVSSYAAFACFSSLNLHATLIACQTYVSCGSAFIVLKILLESFDQ